MSIKAYLSRYFSFWKQYILWKKLHSRILKDSPKLVEGVGQSLVIIPCDIESIGGSRGDEAMIIATIQYYRRLNTNIPIYIVVSNKEGEAYVDGLPYNNIKAINSWNGSYPLEKVYRSIVELNPTDAVILGADCMDGFYSPYSSLMLLAIYDLLASTKGINARLLGFSFNQSPSKLMIFAFKSLPKGLRIRLRDKVSLSRYHKFVSTQAGLVADMAFMLEPDSNFSLYSQLYQWVENQHLKGKKIIGVNFHPMLRKYKDAEDVKSDAVLLANNIESILKRHNDISFVFIPHDDRSRLTDNLMLSTMYDCLKSYKDIIFYSPIVPRAPQLKAICGLLDGLVSSRMHLAIAALGMNKPVMAATYQGKFEGLFQHFDLDQSFLLGPQTFLSDEMITVFERFLESMPSLEEQVKNRLPLVKELSSNNLRND